MNNADLNNTLQTDFNVLAEQLDYGEMASPITGDSRLSAQNYEHECCGTCPSPCCDRSKPGSRIMPMVIPDGGDSRSGVFMAFMACPKRVMKVVRWAT